MGFYYTWKNRVTAALVLSKYMDRILIKSLKVCSQWISRIEDCTVGYVIFRSKPVKTDYIRK